MIDEEIRKIKRPVNTVLQETGKSNVFIVRGRNGYKNGAPVNGKTVGHIIDGMYVPVSEGKKPKRLTQRDITYKYYGKVAFADSMGKDLLNDLMKQYDEADAKKIYCCALLRASYGDIKDYQLQGKYDKSFCSELYPDVPLSKNTVSSLISLLGRDYKGMHDFMKERIASMIKKETEVLIDGMLKQNTSKINTFSGFSYKGRMKGVPDVSIIYAVDAKTREPICMKVYKGNLPDAANFSDFLDEFKIKQGLVVGDKGFPMDCTQNTFKEGKVGFIRPLRRNNAVGRKLGLYDSYSILDGTEKKILCSSGKETDKKGVTRYYYCFQDVDREETENKTYVARAKKKKDFTSGKYREKKKVFGTVVFVSDMELKIESVYQYYKLRWEIETVFNSYKSVLSQTTTREHDDFSVNGSEFIDFLSTIITIRMQNKVVEKKDDLKMDYSQVDESLGDIIKAKIEDTNGTWRLCTMNANERNMLDVLGI